MQQFIIRKNEYLNQDILAFYHSDYSGGGQWRIAGTIENIICTLKNDITPYSDYVLQGAAKQLSSILLQDLPEIIRQTGLHNLTVCVIPRAKAESSYNPNQLLFKAIVRNVINPLQEFNDGTNYIIRHTDTKTTHRAKWGYGGEGEMPYPGITTNTCTISDNVKGRNILLIDDLYTRSINIDEDAIQALLNKNAQRVIFYAIGKTIRNNAVDQPIINNATNEDIDDLPF
jgi:hypothetical protein